MQGKWREAVLVEIQYSEFEARDKSATYRTFTINLKSFDGDDLTHKSFVNINEESGVVRLDKTFTQIITSKMNPKLLLELKNAIGGKDYEKKDEVLTRLNELSVSLGEEASQDYRAFAKKTCEKLEGHQFRVYWRGRGITTTNQTVRAGVGASQIVIFPSEQKDHIKNKSLEDFVNAYREGSMEEKNEEAVSALDDLSYSGSSSSILDEDSNKDKKKSENKEEDDSNFASEW